MSLEVIAKPVFIVAKSCDDHQKTVRRSSDLMITEVVKSKGPTNDDQMVQELIQRSKQ